MTVQELRGELFWIKNQDMTIKELREALFEEMDQNKDVLKFIVALNRKR